MFQVVDAGSCPVEPRIYYMKSRQARHVAQLLEDPPRVAPGKPHFPRQSWLSLGYRVVPAMPPAWPTVVESAGGIVVRAAGPGPFGFPTIW